ncbi:hypothetical protein [Alkaliphilus pronyensis]|uniref:hypothetical protein n=1 Tax=Alkaliphilus pronyensis TaxID=1482732 RepID=UPI0018657DF0|nr:hypothetical protein [Alkaliphilus pronyensis]
MDSIKLKTCEFEINKYINLNKNIGELMLELASIKGNGNISNDEKRAYVEEAIKKYLE